MQSLTPDGRLLLKQFMSLSEEASPEQLNAFIEQVSLGRANSFAWAIRQYLPLLAAREISHLVKVFTNLENALQTGFCGGSTTQVPALLVHLHHRDAPAAEQLTAWAFAVAKNPYNPFGTLNASRSFASSVGEYRRLEAARASHKSETEFARSTTAKERVAQRALRHFERLEEHKKRTISLRAYLAELALLAPTERLRSLIENDWRLGAIPKTYADASAAEGLTIEERQRLVTRLEMAPRGPWSALRASLGARPL